jgi:hypothetical protein
MAKYKPVGSRKKPSAASNARAIPCLIVIVGVLLIVSLLFYEMLKSS